MGSTALELSLKRERDILEEIMENAGTHLAFLDADFNFIKVNTAYARGCGYSKTELIGRNYFELFPDPENETVFKQVRASGERIEFSARPFTYINHPWRGINYWDWTLTPVKNDQGEVEGLVLALSEVTTQIRSHQSLEESLDQIRIMNEQRNLAITGAEHLDAELIATFRAMAEAVVIFDTEGVIQQTNSVASTIFGFDPAGLTLTDMDSKLSIRFLNGEFVKTEEAPASRALRGERVYNEYLIIKNAAGETYTVLVAAAPLIIDGKIAGAVSTWHDVTERERLHAQLEYEQARLQAILEQMPSGVIIVQAPSGKLIMANKQVSRILQCDILPDDSFEIFRKCIAFHPGGGLYSLEEWPLIRSIRNGEVIVDEEMEIIRSDGLPGIVLINSTPIWDREKQIVAVVSILSDITDRRQLEMACQLQQIIEFLPDAIFVLDQERKIIAWNRTIELLTGINKNDIIGKGDYAYAAPFCGKPAPMLIDLFWENVAGIENDCRIFENEGETLYSEVYIPTFNQGKGAYLGIKATPLRDSQWRITGAIASIHDKTKEHEMEEESYKAQKIESIGILAGGIAHDFNNFLAGILANVQLVKMKLAKSLDVTKSLQSIEDTISKAADLTRQLLTFSKGGAPIKKTTLLKDLLHDTTEFALRGSKCKCIFSIPDDLCPVEVDVGQISQVISNLVINADQAMPNGGFLRLTAENIELHETYIPQLSPGKYVLITIKDQGIGISKENLKKIFDPYFTTKPKGNGLGLATSYAIVNNHNGYINVESEVGVGTTFYIYLPAVTGEIILETPADKI
ncbi:MAG: PAS domain S-box protein, partial [Bacillota bacterium]